MTKHAKLSASQTKQWATCTTGAGGTGGDATAWEQGDMTSIEVEETGNVARSRKTDFSQPRSMEFVGVEGDLAPLFNTFRIGTKWQYAGPFDKLRLLGIGPDGGGYPHEVYGTGVVLAVDRGDLRDMLDKHCGLNHGVRYLRQAADQRVELHKILERVYDRQLRGDEKCIVLYVSRLPVA